jgi:hypothetical protein
MQLILFLTHNFKPEFLNTLTKADATTDPSKYKIIVLFDNAHEYDAEINDRFKNTEIVKIDKIGSTYDNLGHSLYVHYFKTHYGVISEYEYVWIFENDVYYPNSLIEFIQHHNSFQYDLLVSEYGTRSPNWYWVNAIGGFKENRNIGVFAFVMRFSQRLLRTLIDTIDRTYYGYLEKILPHICIENDLSIHQFNSDYVGVVATDGNLPLLRMIRNDITNNTREFIETKIYHPIKM